MICRNLKRTLSEGTPDQLCLDPIDKPQYNGRPATGELKVMRCGKPRLPT
jgi:hypothetical protein